MVHIGTTLMTIVALLAAALGITTLLSFVGLALPIPAIVLHPFVLKILLTICGILLFLSSFSVKVKMLPSGHGVPKILATILMVLGAIPLLLEYSVIMFFNVPEGFTIPLIVIGIMLTFYGLYLLSASLKLHRASSIYG